MAFTVSVAPVGVNNGAASTTVSLSLVGCTAGNAVVFGTEVESPTATFTSATLTGESNGVFIGTAAYNQGSSNGDSKVQLGYFKNLTASGTKTLTVTFSASNNGSLWAMEVAGGDTATLIDSHASSHNEGFGVGTTPSLGITTNEDNDLIIGYSVGGVGTDPTQGAGDTLVPVAQLGCRHAGQYQLDAGTHGTPTKTMTIGSSDNWCFAVAAFKVAGGAAPAKKQLLMLGAG